MNSAFPAGRFLMLIALSCLVGCAGGTKTPEIAGAAITGKVVSNGKPLALLKRETISIAFVGQGALEKVTGLATMKEDGTFELKGPSGKGLPPGTYRISLISEIYSGSDNRFQDKFDSDSTPLKFDLPAVDTIALELDLTSRKVVVR
jgi:hypothetical protein